MANADHLHDLWWSEFSSMDRIFNYNQHSY